MKSLDQTYLMMAQQALEQQGYVKGWVVKNYNIIEVIERTRLEFNSLVPVEETMLEFEAEGPDSSVFGQVSAEITVAPSRPEIYILGVELRPLSP